MKIYRNEQHRAGLGIYKEREVYVDGRVWFWETGSDGDAGLNRGAVETGCTCIRGCWLSSTWHFRRGYVVWRYVDHGAR